MVDFYYVDPNYIDYLQTVEKKNRGFTRVPNMRYDPGQNRKFVVGIILSVSGFDYFAPVSHYDKQKANNVLIVVPTDKQKPVKGSVRFNYMFPVKPEYLTKVQINNIPDAQQKRLMQKELKFCMDNEPVLLLVALQTYLNVITQPCAPNYACDFRLLESALSNPPSLDKETGDSDKGLTSVN